MIQYMWYVNQSYIIIWIFIAYDFKLLLNNIVIYYMIKLNKLVYDN